MNKGLYQDVSALTTSFLLLIANLVGSSSSLPLSAELQTWCVHPWNWNPRHSLMPPLKKTFFCYD